MEIKGFQRNIFSALFNHGFFWFNLYQRLCFRLPLLLVLHLLVHFQNVQEFFSLEFLSKFRGQMHFQPKFLNSQVIWCICPWTFPPVFWLKFLKNSNDVWNLLTFLIGKIKWLHNSSKKFSHWICKQFHFQTEFWSNCLKNSKIIDLFAPKVFHQCSILIKIP